MRISDWSSDVCSSDLSGKCWPRRRFPKRIRECSHVASKAGETGLAARYALALFDLADERKALDQVAEDLTKVESAIAGRAALRSEERRVGKECVSTCRSRWSQCHEKKNNTQP